jgi:DNA-binding transcriptional MerR regulator
LTILIVEAYDGCMNMLQQFARQNPAWSLEEFVEVANDLLPQFLPEQPSGSRGQEPVNPRLVRHYTTQGLIDKPQKEGREARYRYRHLLQLLVLRRLLAEGYSTSSVGSLIVGQVNAVLEELLQGGVQLTVETANPALAFLSQVRDRERREPSDRGISAQEAKGARRLHSPARPANMPEPTEPPVAAQPPAVYQVAPPPPSPAPQHWTRLEILDGLELHVRQGFKAPTTAHERESLLRLITDHLTHLTQSRRIPP